MKKLSLLLFFSLCLFRTTSFARAKSKQKKQKKESSYMTKGLGYVDNTQRFISSMWVGLNHNLDMYFSNQNYSIKNNKSKILLSYDVFKAESEELEKAFDIKLKVHFPKISKKLSVVLERQRNEIVETNTNYARRSQTSSEGSYTAGVNFLVKKSPFFNTTFDTGIKLNLPTDPFAKFNLYKRFNTSIMNIYASQKLILYRQDGFSEITQLTFSRGITKNVSISQSNSLSWADKTDELTHRNSLNLGQSLRKSRSLSYSIGANAIFRPVFHYVSYDASVSFSTPIYKTWLKAAFATGANFKKEDDWNMTNFALVRLTMLFI